MATTGADLKAYLNQKFDQAYSAYFDDTKLNRLIRESAYRSAEIKYRELLTQKQYDELRGFLKVNQVLTLSNSRLYTDPIQIVNVTGSAPITVTTSRPHYLVTGQSVTLSEIQGTAPLPNGSFAITVTGTRTFTANTSFGGAYVANTGLVTPANAITDYYHYLTSKAYILGTAVNITAVTTGATTIVTAPGHNLRSGDSVGILNVGGVTGINTQHDDITVLNATKFQIGTTSGTYTSGGTVQLVNYNYATLLRPDKKTFVYSSANANFPKYEIGESMIIYSPSTTEVTIDYMAKLPFEINVTDDTVDLEIYYNPKFLYYICDQIVLNEGSQVRDGEIQQSASQAIVNNP